MSEYEEQMLINNLSELKMSFIKVKQSVEYVDKNSKVLDEKNKNNMISPKIYQYKSRLRSNNFSNIFHCIF